MLFELVFPKSDHKELNSKINQPFKNQEKVKALAKAESHEKELLKNINNINTSQINFTTNSNFKYLEIYSIIVINF